MANNSEQHPVVSVILPTYNRASLISRAIRSVLNQTFTDWELLIVDDGSTDATEQLIRSRSADSRIRYMKLPQNVGMCNARNHGIALARGEFIAFLDSDDEWLPTKLEKQLAVFRRDGPQTGLV